MLNRLIAHAKSRLDQSWNYKHFPGKKEDEHCLQNVKCSREVQHSTCCIETESNILEEKPCA